MTIPGACCQGVFNLFKLEGALYSVDCIIASKAKYVLCDKGTPQKYTVTTMLPKFKISVSLILLVK